MTKSTVILRNLGKSLTYNESLKTCCIIFFYFFVISLNFDLREDFHLEGYGSSSCEKICSVISKVLNFCND